MGMNLSSASSTPIALGKDPYLTGPRLEMWAKYQGMGADSGFLGVGLIDDSAVLEFHYHAPLFGSAVRR